ncbi:nitrile hydratase accessory protein [Pseudonocardia phyllosphaerae]|uniref:nitrile hydratase accessory protein n=1 Tax=Pseudonocardia phyllosphaerae TaxID=3390502 RepID=UPI00397C5562
MSRPVLDVDGPAAPPRSNGELVFAEPWEGRAFAMAVGLADGGVLAWDEFRARLVVRIAEAREPFSYYGCWLAALEDLLVGTGRIGDGAVHRRAGALASRPAGHDHRHQHGHGHDHKLDGHDHSDDHLAGR